MSATPNDPPVSSNVPSDVLEEMAALRRIFLDSRMVLAEDRSVDLTGLDERIRRFCQRVETLPPEARRPLINDFNELLEQLRALEHELHAAHGRATSGT